MTRSGSSKKNKTPKINIVDLKFEHLREALGVGVANPRLSWITATDTNNWRQSGYEIEVYLPDGTLLDNTGLVKSGDSVLVAWPFKPLMSRERRLVRVRAWGFD